MSGAAPAIYTCSEAINNADYLDINFGVCGFASPPTITANANVNINIYVSDVTYQTARINFSQKFVGTVYYTVIGIS